MGVDVAAEQAATFAAGVAEQGKSGHGEPEAAMSPLFATLLKAVGALDGIDVQLHAESHLSDVSAIPDYAVTVKDVVVGYVELKKPGTGVDTSLYTGKNKIQWEKLSALPNLLYCDGTEWAVYHQGTLHGTATFDRDIRKKGASLADAESFVNLLMHFLTWTPVPPTNYRQLADVTARLCRLLRDEVAHQIVNSDRLQSLAADWRDLLFPEADDEAFANQYAQTVTFALLLARADNISFEHKTLPQIALELGDDHSLLGRALQLLTDGDLTKALATSLEPLRQVIGAVNWDQLKAGTSEPWLHFYEHFLERYDPELRKATGSYYTPDEVVNCIVRLVDEALENHLGIQDGLMNDQVTILDPATGTGTFLLRTIDHIIARAQQTSGPGYVPTVIDSLPSRLIGFEIQTGPYAVAQLRVFDRLNIPGTNVSPGDIRLHVADTLDDPHTHQPKLLGLNEPISKSRSAANNVKANEQVLAIFGNPPYADDAAALGGWVLNGNPNEPSAALMESFRAPLELKLGKLEHLLNNLHVFFWRWAIHKAFEAHPDSPHGVVGFITPSAWLTAKGLTGMRHYLRGIADHIYVIDLGGDNRGARKEPNVFAIETPVAITIAVRDGSRDGQDALVWYRRIRGDQTAKFAQLDPEAHPEHPAAGTPIRLDDGDWQEVLSERTGPIAAAVTPTWQSYPALTDLAPWTPPGVKPNRTWVYAPDKQTLHDRWERLITENDTEAKRKLARETESTRLDETIKPLPGQATRQPLSTETSPANPIVRIAYRSFDRQWLIADARVLHRPSPDLWRCWSDQQAILSYNQADPNGPGLPTLFSANLVDQGHFNVRNDVAIPLWRNVAATIPNVTPGLLGHLTQIFDRTVEGPDLFAYIAATTSHPNFSERFWDELEAPGLRLPLTSDANLFFEAVELGRLVIWVHTYGERFVDPADGRPAGPPRAVVGSGPKIDVPIPTTPDGMPERLSYDLGTQMLHVGKGRISNVTSEVFNFEVSGMNVLKRWFSYRKRNPAGKKTSDLDRINPDRWTKTTIDELLNLLHVLQRTVDLHGQQADLLDRIVSSNKVSVHDLTQAGVLPVPESATKPLKANEQPTLPTT